MSTIAAEITSSRDALVPGKRVAAAQRAHFVLCVAAPAIVTVTLPWLWPGTLASWRGLVIFAIMYFLVGAVGVTVGLHRLFSHHAFHASRWVAFTCGVLGSMAAQGSLVYWVSLHRRHHTFSDAKGDPHSPCTSADPSRGIFRAFLHGHIGWTIGHDVPKPTRYAIDILHDRLLLKISRNYWLWVTSGVVLPAILGGALFGSIQGLVIGAYWGGAVRITLMHQVIWAVNSVGHTVGRRRYATRDRSRNVWLLAVPSFGETWHNNHHFAPTAARLGHAWWEVDIGWWVIRALQRTGAATQVRPIPVTRQIKQSPTR